MTKEAEWVIEQAKMLTRKELIYIFYTLREVIWESGDRRRPAAGTVPHRQ